MGAVSPGDSNQKIMGSFRFGLALLVLVSVVTAKDVFRYDDEKTGQSHYMTGDPEPLSKEVGPSPTLTVHLNWSIKQMREDSNLQPITFLSLLKTLMMRL